MLSNTNKASYFYPVFVLLSCFFQVSINSCYRQSLFLSLRQTEAHKINCPKDPPSVENSFHECENTSLYSRKLQNVNY